MKVYALFDHNIFLGVYNNHKKMVDAVREYYKYAYGIILKDDLQCRGSSIVEVSPRGNIEDSFGVAEYTEYDFSE